jgi:hypothetical protein
MKAQAIYVFVCLVLFSSVEAFKEADPMQRTPYKLFQELRSGALKLENVLVEDFFKVH